MTIFIWKTENVSAVVDNDQILTLIENNPRHTTRNIAEIFHISHMSVIRHLKTLGYINRYDVWVSQFDGKNLMDCIFICDSLLKRNENNPFLKRITGEKWIVYINVEQKRGKMIWAIINRSKGRSASEESDVVYLVGLEEHHVLRTFSTQLNDKFGLLFPIRPTIDEKRSELANRKGVVFQNNARPHVSLHTQQKLMQLGWDVLPHPPYSPDLAPSNHLFRSLQNFLNGKNFDSLEACKNHLKQFIVQKNVKFWNYDATSKMAKSSGTKWHICDWINPCTNI